jgi:hypothetical protein
MPHCCHYSVCLQPSLCHKACLKSFNLSHQVLALLLIASLASQGFDANLRCAVATKLWRPSLRGLGRPSLVGYRTAQPWSRRPSPPLVELRRRASLTKPSQAKPYCTLVLPSPIRPSGIQVLRAAPGMRQHMLCSHPTVRCLCNCLMRVRVGALVRGLQAGYGGAYACCACFLAVVNLTTT